MIKTLIDVTCSEQGKAQPFTGLVIGRILNVDLHPEFLGVHFQYEKEDGTVLLKSDQNNPKVLTKVEVNAFYDLIKASLPTSVDWYTDTFTELYAAFKVEMADTFGITTEQIENV